MSEPTVYPATLADATAITGLLMQLFQQEKEFVADFNRQQQAVTQIINQPERGQFLVMKQDNNVIGVVSLLFLLSTAMGGKVALLEDMIIAQHYRHQGLGKKLLSAALSVAKAQGCLRITLLTDVDNLPAQALYQQLGFVASSMLPMRLEI